MEHEITAQATTQVKSEEEEMEARTRAHDIIDASDQFVLVALPRKQPNDGEGTAMVNAALVNGAHAPDFMEALMYAWTRLAEEYPAAALQTLLADLAAHQTPPDLPLN